MNFIFQLFVYVVLAIAGSIMSAAQEQQQKNAPGIRSQRQEGGNNSKAVVVGQRGVAGQFEYWADWGNDGETPNAFHSEVYSLGDKPYHGFPGFFFNGAKGTLAYNRPHPELGIPVEEARRDGKDHLWVKFYDGRQTVADAMLVSRTAGQERAWAADMIFVGCPYVVVTSLLNREIFTGIPKYLFEVQGIDLYDMSLDSSMGGDGPQRYDDPSTWTYSNDPMVAASNVFLGIYYGDEWLYGGQTITPYQLRPADLIKQIRKSKARGFTCGYEIVCGDVEPHVVIGELLMAAAARVAEIGGSYRFLVAEPDEPVRGFTDEDIFITEDQELDPFPGLESTCNVINSSYPEPAEAWGMKQAPSRYSSVLEAEDDGRRLPKSITYNAVYRGAQVQELDKMAVEEARRFASHINVMSPAWWEAEPLDAEVWTSERNGYVAKQFLIIAMDDQDNGDQILARREIDPSDYSWSSDMELPWTTAPLGLGLPAPQVVSGPSVQPVPGELAYDVFWSAASVAVDVQFVRVSHQRLDGALPYTVLVPKPNLLTGAARVPVGIELSAKSILVQLEYVPHSGRPTIASEWMPVTIADVRLGLDSLVDDVMAGLEAIIRPTPMSVQAQIAELRDDFDRFAAKVWDHTTSYDRRTTKITAELNHARAEIVEDRQVFATQTEAGAMRLDITKAEFNNSISGVTQTVNTLASDLSAEASARIALAAQVGSDIAALQQDFLTYVGPEGSITQAVTNLSASFNGFTLNGAVGFRLEATPDGAIARYAIVIRANGQEAAALYMDAVPNGSGGTKGRLAVIAEELYLLNSAGGYISSPFYVSAGFAYIHNLQIGFLQTPGGGIRMGTDGGGGFIEANSA